ncbi:universal stress protein [Ammoniphilus sp. CFH 90114]|uniref:universal stress protein n=1 Tax=Ammoniphilus sp. CFH 90114 TaxID=2493665 RepID=UPI00100F3169|nr:universal stress protein [Ammoniphilus sp. CFH 90114]RXT06469.1 universal stress protein [Ammoniphilus sp. CFH 90114]
MFSLYSKIVVAYDHSELGKKALSTAMLMASQDERIDLDVLTVVSIPTSAFYTASAYSVDPIREAHLAVAKEALEEVTEKLKTIPNKTRTFVMEGNPAQAILDFSKENNASLIVMGSRGLSGVKELFLGSVSHYVVQQSTCPVYIVK